MVPVLFLFCVALWFILRGASCSKVFPCSLSSCFFISCSIGITSLGEEVAGLCVSRAFVCLFDFLHVLVSVLFPFLLVSGVGCGLWLWHSLEFSINFNSTQPSKWPVLPGWCCTSVQRDQNIRFSHGFDVVNVCCGPRSILMPDAKLVPGFPMRTIVVQ